MRRRVLLVMVALSFAFGFSPAAQATYPKTQKITLTVFAASSLGQTFTAIGHEFEAKHPGVSVQFSFLASSTLATQLVAGAPADVFASASPTDMALAQAVVPTSTIFTANRVVLAFPKLGRFHINKIVDLNIPGLRWIQCAHQVPCGAAADAALAKEKVVSKPVSLEPKVSSAVAKLVAGEVDAAIIFHSDFFANRATLDEIRFASMTASMTKYPIGVVKTSSHAELAQAFVDTVISPFGRKILSEAGFIRVN